LPVGAEIWQQALELPPGWRESKGYGGFAASLLMDGEVRFSVNGNEKSYKAGEAWSVHTRLPVEGENLSGKEARIFTTYLLPKGADLTSIPGPGNPDIITNPSRPNDSGNGWLWPALAIALLVTGIILAGRTLLRRSRSR
jgi:hypothetical protein